VKTPLLDIPFWRVKSAEHVFLHGASGSGKSTLLNLISGVLPLKQGELKLLGQSFNTLSQRKRDKFRAVHLGMVFQQFNLIPYLSILDNLNLANHVTRSTKGVLRSERITVLMERLKLSTQLLNRTATELSIGQRQKVAIIRALINTPEIIIADEPTSSLDSDSRDAFMNLLIELCEENASTLIFVSHDRALMSYFDQSYDLADLNRSKREIYAA
jgi:putative ABC transport system ATP-binding protein